RSGANKNARDRVEHLFGRATISRLIHVHQNIGAVKRNDARFRPRPNQRQKMSCDMPEKNMEKLRVFAAENFGHTRDFALGKLPRLVAQLSAPEAPQKIPRRFGDDAELSKRES